MAEFHETAKLLTGEATSPFGDPFPSAIAYVSHVLVQNNREVPKKEASISVDIYASLEAFDDPAKQPFETRKYYFTVGGRYQFELVFGIPGTTLVNIFNYLQTLPEFESWVDVDDV